METKLTTEQLNTKKQYWDYNQGLAVSSNDSKWRLTGFYGHLDTSKREETWTLLESLSRLNNISWLCLGDYNEILYRSEKHGGSPRPSRQMDYFHRAINTCELRDLGFFGSPFTWSRNHPIDGRIHIRLDRALASSAWKSSFPGAIVHHLAMSTSDHSMLSVHLPSSGPRRRFTKTSFRFKAMWLRHPGCVDVVQEAWLEVLCKPDGTQLTNCLDSCRTKLSVWNKTDFGHVGRQVDRLTKKLQALERQPINNADEIHKVRKALNCWLDAENTMWHQRARSMWITDGDRNTNFFHQKASNRKQ
ncbi:uncharacterized protein LOC142621846 [Castanea sativa]|uniref:uncharacterized protein LOC142621846 n=1 Tax=Castanea sativa TaxID=21020 RepID=UPI003F64D090